MDTQPKPKYSTGLEEAFDRLARVTEKAVIRYETIPWWNIKERFIAQGSLGTLNIILELIHQLQHKYDNRDGRLN